MKTIPARLTLIWASLIIISLILTAQNSAAVTLNDAVGIWLFDETNGDTAWDSSGNGNDGAINGATRVDGKFGKALEFDGSDDNVDCGNDASLDLTDAITIMAWAKLNKLNQMAAILEKRNCGAGGNGYALLNGWDRNTYMELTNMGIWVQSGGLETDKWYHFASTWDSATGKTSFYQDGVVVQTKNQGAGAEITVNDTSLLIGQRTGGCTGNFSGIIDEVAVFNVALAEDDINDLMGGGFPFPGAVSPSGKLTTVWSAIKTQ